MDTLKASHPHFNVLGAQNGKKSIEILESGPVDIVVAELRALDPAWLSLLRYVHLWSKVLLVVLFRLLLDVFFVFGGTKIVAPADWKIKIDVVSIFGGFSDKRSNYPADTNNSEKVLFIKGMTVFGGGEIKNF